MVIKYRRFMTAADMHDGSPDGAHPDDLNRARILAGQTSVEAARCPCPQHDTAAALAYEALRKIEKARGII